MKLNLNILPEPTDSRYSIYNTGSVEMEVGEFLYGFIRMIKPEAILETGTYKGVSAALMGLALKENGFGKLTTVEYEPSHYRDATSMFSALGLDKFITALYQDANTLQTTDNKFDFIFLDTEPHLRFGEFLRFWHSLKPGGFIGIHDLGAHMGQTGNVVNDMKDWPFGTMPDEMKKIYREECENIHFNTPRGLYLAQKHSPGFYI